MGRDPALAAAVRHCRGGAVSAPAPARRPPRGSPGLFAAAGVSVPGLAAYGLQAAGVPGGMARLAAAALLLAMGVWYSARRGPRVRWAGATPPAAWLAAVAAGALLAGYQAWRGPFFIIPYLGPADWGEPVVWAHLGAAGLLAPLAEELFFRGILQARLQDSLGPRPAWLAAAVLFALAHLDLRPARMAELAAAGLVYGGLYRAGGSVLPPALAHALNNLAAVFWAR